MGNRPNFNEIADKLEQYVNVTLPSKAEDLVLDSIDENFDSESYNGQAWQPLSEKYAKRKGSGKKILNDTGDMQSGLSSKVAPAEITISTDVGYAGYHNEGGEIPGRPPKRQFIPTEDNPDIALETEIQNMIESDVSEIIHN